MSAPASIRIAIMNMNRSHAVHEDEMGIEDVIQEYEEMIKENDEMTACLKDSIEKWKEGFYLRDLFGDDEKHLKHGKNERRPRNIGDSVRGYNSGLQQSDIESRRDDRVTKRSD